MHFAVDEPIRVILANFINNIVDFFKIGIFAARTVSRIRKHGDLGFFVGVGDKSLSRVFDYSVELFFGRELIDSTIGES